MDSPSSTQQNYVEKSKLATVRLDEQVVTDCVTTSVDVIPSKFSGPQNRIAEIRVNGKSTFLSAPAGGGGGGSGSNVYVEDILGPEGHKPIANIYVDGVPTTLYQISSSEVVVNDFLSTQPDRYEIASICVDGISTAIHALSSTNVSVDDLLSSDPGAMDVAKIYINGVPTTIHALSAQEISVDEQTLINIRKLVGLSTLDAYTYVGDDINHISSALSDISNDVLWFDTKDDPSFHPIDGLNRIDNLQVQIYRLGLQLRDVHKILENGVIPGEAYNNTKDEMIEFADLVLPPDESLDEDSKLLQIFIYGNYYCKNKQPCYMMLNPASFAPTRSKFTWLFDEDDSKLKRLSASAGGVSYFLAAGIEEQASACIGKLALSAGMCETGQVIELSDMTTEQSVIDEVIRSLSAAGQSTEVGIYISSNYYDEDFKIFIKSDPCMMELVPGATDAKKSLISVDGNDYIDKSALYYAVVDENVKRFPLNVNTDWYFLSSGWVQNPGDPSPHMETVRTSSISRTFQPSPVKDPTRVGIVTYDLLQYVGTPICQISAVLSNCTEQEAKDISATVHVESRYDASLSATKDILGVGGVKPDTRVIEPTVKAVCAKFDSKASLIEKQKTLYPGELVYFKDANQLAVWTGTTFMVLNSSASQGVTKEEIQDIELDHMTFKPGNAGTILNKISTTSDGKLKVMSKASDDSASDYETQDTTWEVYVSGKLQIGKIYCGGHSLLFQDVVNNKLKPSSLVSHNFVEIVNASDKDIYLDKIYLMYHTSDSDFAPASSSNGWEFVKLEGIIKAHGTYLVRGAECNPCKNTMIRVDECDLEWRAKRVPSSTGGTDGDVDVVEGEYVKFTRTGKLMEFSQKTGAFFLCYATKNSADEFHGANIAAVVNGMNPSTPAPGYIDLIGLGSDSYCEKKTFSIPSGSTSFDNQLLVKWYYMDPASQGNKKRTERSNKTLMTNINLEKQAAVYYNKTEEEFKKLRNAYYYNDEMKVASGPRTSKSSDGIFAGKTHFKKSEPNAVNLTFGIQATHNESKGKLASRCFNWVSVGWHDEYVELKHESDAEWKPEYRFYSIVPTDKLHDDAEKNSFMHKFYDRLRWTASDGTFATTHKVVVHEKLKKGKWQYRIGRVGDASYTSGVKTFIVHSDAEVNAGFSFIQTSDQQGFNWIEYQAWRASCAQIKRSEKKFNFTINTGDIAQSGNRASEWLDYFSGKEAFDGIEEMFTIGNNDLCGSPEHVLGDGADNSSKFNLINILYYYTFELDPNNLCVAKFTDSKGNVGEYPIYSLYSFNYGKWHFISLVSEIRSLYGAAFPQLPNADYTEFAKALNADVERWLVRDLVAWKSATGESDCQKCIIYMHEMPFTIVTTDYFDITGEGTSSLGRSNANTGSKLNVENGLGDYRFSRIFKKAGVRLVMGGHKHTFCLTNPVFDAPSAHPLPNASISLQDYELDPFIYEGVGVIESRKPVIELPIAGVVKFAQDTSRDPVKIPNAGVRAELSVMCNELSTATEANFRSKFQEVLDYTSSKGLVAFNQLDDRTPRLQNFIRFSFVEKVTAPTMVMSQATGYKVVSNKEIPSGTKGDAGNIARYTPWLMSYCAGTGPTRANKKFPYWSNTKNPVQCRPTYVRYDLANDISVTIKQIDGVYNIQGGGDYAAYDLDTQQTALSSNPVTFGAFGKSMGDTEEIQTKWFIPTTLPEYMASYGAFISNDVYTIKL